MKPLTCIWDGEIFKPLGKREWTSELAVGEIYRAEIVSERSAQSHNHYFATLFDLWSNLPDELKFKFPSAEALRKYALIATGHRKERTLILETNEQAERVAAFMRNDVDNYAVISVNDNAIVEWKPQSQSRAAMPTRDEFQKSKDDVFRWIEDLLSGNANR